MPRLRCRCALVKRLSAEPDGCRLSLDVIAIAGRAARAELAWRGADGALDAIPIVPLTVDGEVIAALPFSDGDVARRVATTRAATLVFSDSRMAHRGWAACAVPVTADVAADRTGEWTWTGALDQEVRKHPPARLLIDTAIQRREHWWYVPRWIVRLRVAGAAQPVARRHAPGDGLLFVGGGQRPAAHTIAVDDWTADVVRFTPLAAGAGPTAVGSALVFGHDFSIPDQERSSRVALHGDLDGRQLRVRRREGDLALPEPRLRDRLRAHYRLARACRRALATYDASPSDAAT